MKKDLLHEYEKEHLFRAFRNKQVRIHADLLKNPFAPIIVHANTILTIIVLNKN